MKRILITGGMGFIGKVLCRKLLEDENNYLEIVDNLSSSKVDKEIAEHPRVTFIYDDMAEYLKFREPKPMDQIYHLAAPVGPVGILKHIGRIGYAIMHDLTLVSDLALTHGAKLIYISTSEVYGCNPVNGISQSEDIPKIVPAEYTVRLEYGVGKLLGEIMLSNLRREMPIRYNAIRPFNIVGIDQNGDLGFVLPRFVDQALNGKPITVYNDGSDLRTFTNVKDFVDAIYAVMESEVEGEVFNVGNPANVCSIKDLAELVQKLTESRNGATSPIDYVDPTILHGKNFAEAWNKIPDITKLKTMIGWEPKYDLEATVTEVIDKMRGKNA